MRRAFASFRQSSLDGLTGGMTTRAGYGGLSRPRPSNRWLAAKYIRRQPWNKKNLWWCKFFLDLCLVANIFEDKTFMRKEISVHNMVPSNSVLERNNGLEKEEQRQLTQFFGWRKTLTTSCQEEWQWIWYQLGLWFGLICIGLVWSCMVW